MEKFYIENVVYSSVYHLESYQNDWTSKMQNSILHNSFSVFSIVPPKEVEEKMLLREREREREMDQKKWRVLTKKMQIK